MSPLAIASPPLRFFFLVFVVLALGLRLPVDACQICIPYPQASVADHLLEAEVVILAREDPERPFSFRATETLHGLPPGPGQIDLFIDSHTRRLLKVKPETAIVLARKPDPSGESRWIRLGEADPALRPVVRDVLSNAPAWRQSPRARFDYFAERLDHEDSDVSTLARLEVASAPYRDIRTLGDAIPREELLNFLGQVRYLEWHPLYILLLANDATDEDRERIRGRVESAATHGTTLNLGAWATAFLEIDRETALAYLEENYLDNPDRDPKEVAEIVKAIAVHGNAEATLPRERLITAFARLLETHPDQAPAIVASMKAWKRRDLGPQIQKIAEQRPPLFDLTTLLQLRAYARSARP